MASSSRPTSFASLLAVGLFLSAGMARAGEMGMLAYAPISRLPIEVNEFQIDVNSDAELCATPGDDEECVDGG